MALEEGLSSKLYEPKIVLVIKTEIVFDKTFIDFLQQTLLYYHDRNTLLSQALFLRMNDVNVYILSTYEAAFSIFFLSRATLKI